MRRRQSDGQQAGQNHQKRKQHFGNRGDEWNPPRRVHVFGRHGGLDDEEVGAPVAGAQHESKAHADADDLDAHGIGVGVQHPFPLVHVGDRAATPSGRPIRRCS